MHFDNGGNEPPLNPIEDTKLAQKSTISSKNSKNISDRKKLGKRVTILSTDQQQNKNVPFSSKTSSENDDLGLAGEKLDA